MKKKLKVGLLVLAALVILVQVILFVCNRDMVVLNPKGWIAFREKELLWITTLLMLTVVVPALLLTVIICVKYRAGNKKAKYDPEWDNSHLLEWIWWGFPLLIVGILSVITWKGCIELDPYKPLVHDKKPVRIQVVALQWKWLFIYPEQKIATINFVQFPEKTPVNFEITADAPMNSFWIPQLGGQIYAMAAMSTKLHLIAEEAGSYRGCSANISGIGFSGMVFTAKASSDQEFDEWVKSVKGSPQGLTSDLYEKLVEPTEYDPPSFYTLEDEGLYDAIIMKYMVP